MTAAKEMNVIVRLPDCDGPAADAISAYTQVKMEDAPKLLEIPKSEWMSRRMDTLSKTQMAEIMVQYGRRPSRSSRAKSVRSSFGRTIMGTTIWRITDGTWMEKVPHWECLFVHRKQKLFFSVYVDDIKMAGKKRNIAPMWKKVMKDVDLNETSFLDHVYLGCTQRECKPNDTIIEQYKGMFESRTSAGATEKLPG